MATREENLKKINSELEMLSDEELEQVVGGGTRQLCGDNDLMIMLGLSHYEGTIFWDGDNTWSNCSEKVEKGWKEVGILCCSAFGAGNNRYFIGTEEITRKKAFVHALKSQGWTTQKILHEFDFDSVKGSW